MRASALLLAALTVAGCLAPTESAVTPSAAPDAEAASGLVAVVAHDTAGAVAAPAGDLDAVSFALLPTGLPRGEPTIGITSSGAMFVPVGKNAITGQPSGGRVSRSTDGGATWTDVTDNLLGPKADLDPFVYVDPLTDRIFHMPLYVACSWISWSDDDGESWSNNPLGGCGIPAHDHQKLAAAPPLGEAKTSGYPNVVYYAYNSFRGEGTWISRSFDGGRSFEVGRPIMPDDCHSGVNGPVHGAADGVVYVASAACEDIEVAVTRDSGATWEVVSVGKEVGVNPYIAVNPNVATDADGNAYVVWPGKDALLYMSVSRDQGATWSAPVRVSPPGATSTVFSVIAAGATGRVAIAYLATDADTSKWETPQAHDADDRTEWHLMVTFADDALAASPTFVTHRVTPEDDPAQIGCVWLTGGNGGPRACRNLLDFIGIATHEGRVHVVFADGCIGSCASGSPEKDSRSRVATVAVVGTGPSLADPAVRLAPLGPPGG